MLVSLCYLLLLALCFPPDFVGSPSTPKQRQHCHEDEGSALLQFKQSFLSQFPCTNYGIDVDSWNIRGEEGANCCSWEGVGCHESTGHVISLNLSGSCLLGSINSSSSLFRLVHLRSLILSYNNFNHSQIPWQIGRLSSLTHLNLSYSSFSGPIPSSMFELERLENLGLQGNNLSGTVELDMFAKFKYMANLSLSGNKLWVVTRSTRINATFPQLINLGLSACNLSEFPGFLQSQHELRVLELAGNNIGGLIPSWVFQTLVRLRTLNLKNNRLHGSLPIPSPSIEWYDVSGNSFTGRLPPVLCNSSNLQCLDVSSNNLSGTIPEAFKSGSRLRSIYLNANNFSGQLPRSLAHCRELEILDSGNNRISDTFPSWLGVAPKLYAMVLRSNRFHGSITPLGEAKNRNFPKLRIVDLSCNNFSGSLPAAYFPNWNAMKLSRSFNQQLALRSIRVNNKGVNTLYQNIPDSLKLIDLSHNRFTGSIPESIGDLKGLLCLNFSSNSLTGSVPPAMGNLSDLESLDLSRNKLSGHIPDHLTQLTFLAVLNVSYNNLYGPIPQGKQFFTFQNDSYTGNSGLCGYPLSKECGISPDTSTTDEEDHQDSGVAVEFDWVVMCTGFAGGLLVGVVIGTCQSARKYEWLLKTLGGSHPGRGSGEA